MESVALMDYNETIFQMKMCDKMTLSKNVNNFGFWGINKTLLNNLLCV